MTPTNCFSVSREFKTQHTVRVMLCSKAFMASTLIVLVSKSAIAHPLSAWKGMDADHIFLYCSIMLAFPPSCSLLVGQEGWAF